MVALLTALLLTSVGLAGTGTASPSPPPPPEVPLEALPAEAVSRPAGTEERRHPVKAHILADQDAVRPGEPFRLGIYLVQDKGWHTYWKSPGDIGLPTEITWSLPDGSTAGPYEFPVPQRFELETIVSYGYDDQVLFFSEVTLPDDLPAETLLIEAHVGWLVCEVTCIPGETTVRLPLQVLPADAEAPGSGRFAPLFDHFAAQHPVPHESVEALSFQIEASADALVPGEDFQVALKVRATDGSPLAAPPGGATWPTFVPILTDDVFVLETHLRPTADGALVALLSGEALPMDELPGPSRMGGLWTLEVGEQSYATEVALKLPWATEASPADGALLPLARELADEAPAEGDEAVAAGVLPGGPEPASSFLSLPWMLGAAFLGGLLLNIMPCVLPVLTIKLYGLIHHGGHSPAFRRNAGLAYTGGILASFGVLAAVVLIIQASVGGVGWGFQFQYPVYVAVLGAIVFAFGLSLLGVFELPAIGANAMAQAAEGRDGLGSHFGAGVFATLLGTPCSAPFLGPAVGFAFAQPPAVIVLFFGVIGLGLAFPFLLVAFVPALFRLLPKPGAWMEVFKHLMGFTLIATTVWLVSVLAAQVGMERAVGYLAFLGFVGFGAWLFGRIGGVGATGRQQLAGLGAASLAIALGAWGFLELEEAHAVECDDGVAVTDGLDFERTVPWQPFSEERIEALAGHPIFIDFTAQWCLSCKVNERTIIDTARVRQAMSDQGIVPLKADWTRRDPVITAWLQRFGRAGVPFYLVIPADRDAEPIALPEVITPDMLIGAFQEAAAPPDERAALDPDL